MLCSNCKKNEATVQIYRNINGAETKCVLCDKCAQELNAYKFVSDSIGYDSFFGGSLLEGFGSMLGGMLGLEGSPSAGRICSSCGTNIDDILSSGMVGCSNCYSQFEHELRPLIMRLHGTAGHEGSVPESAGAEVKRERELKELKTKLKKAVEEQDFEQAAVLRDKIKELEGGNK